MYIHYHILADIIRVTFKEISCMYVQYICMYVCRHTSASVSRQQ